MQAQGVATRVMTKGASPVLRMTKVWETLPLAFFLDNSKVELWGLREVITALFPF